MNPFFKKMCPKKQAVTIIKKDSNMNQININEITYNQNDVQIVQATVDRLERDSLGMQSEDMLLNDY